MGVRSPRLSAREEVGSPHLPPAPRSPPQVHTRSRLGPATSTLHANFIPGQLGGRAQRAHDVSTPDQVVSPSTAATRAPRLHARPAPPLTGRRTPREQGGAPILLPSFVHGLAPAVSPPAHRPSRAAGLPTPLTPHIHNFRTNSTRPAGRWGTTS